MKKSAFVLVAITISGLLTLDYQNIGFARALGNTLHKIQSVFTQPALHVTTFADALYA